MRFITRKIHGILDYATVLGFAAIPSLFGLSGLPAYLAYTLAAVHLLMTLLTDFPFGLIKVIPIKIHQIIETIVGPVLIAAPWAFGFADDSTAKTIFITAGVIIALVSLTTNYAESDALSF